LSQPESIPLAFDPLDVAVHGKRMLGNCFQSLNQRPTHLGAHLAEAALGGAGQNKPRT
jgi:hypothetical protein